MNNDSLDPSFLELIKAFESGLIDNAPDPTYEYRWYYDEHGNIRFGTTTEKEALQLKIDLPYIVVTKEQYLDSHRYRVYNNKLYNRHDQGQRVQLVKSNTGHQVVKNHAALLLEPNETYDQTEYYDYRNY